MMGSEGEADIAWVSGHLSPQPTDQAIFLKIQSWIFGVAIRRPVHVAVEQLLPLHRMRFVDRSQPCAVSSFTALLYK